MCLSIFLFSCSNDLETIKEISIQNQSVFPVETIKDFEIIYSDSSKVRVLLSASIMNRFNHEKKYVEIEDGLKVQFFDESGKKESELLSDYAIIDEENDVIQAQKNVVVRNVNGDVLESETLNWSQKKQEIFTDDFIKITTDNEVIFGQGLVSNQNFTKYTIKKIIWVF
mgnify:FL=1